MKYLVYTEYSMIFLYTVYAAQSLAVSSDIYTLQRTRIMRNNSETQYSSHFSPSLIREKCRINREKIQRDKQRFTFCVRLDFFAPINYDYYELKYACNGVV